MPYPKIIIWLIEKAVECALGTALIMAYFAFDSRLMNGPAVQEMLSDYFQIYRGLFIAFYVTLGYGLTSVALNVVLYRRAKPISMVWRIGLNLAVFSLSFGAGIALLTVTFIEGNWGMPVIYQLGLILYPISLVIVALTTYAGQKVRDRLAAKP